MQNRGSASTNSEVGSFATGVFAWTGPFAPLIGSAIGTAARTGAEWALKEIWSE